MAQLLSKNQEKVISKESSVPTSEKALPTKAALSPEIRAGFLVTCAMGVLLFLLFKAGDVQIWKGQRELPILFNYISGLEKNAPVHFSGHKIGKVARVEFLNTENQAKIKVTVSIEKNVPVRTDSEVFIDVLGFMGEKFVEISPGTPQAQLLEEGKSLTGTDPVALMKVVKDATELLGQFQEISASMRELMENLEGITGRNEKNLDEIFGNLNESSKNLKEMTSDLKLHPWKLLKKDSGKKKRFLIV